MELAIIISCLLLSAFFSGMEIAFVSSNKIYLEIEKKQDNFLSRILFKLTKKPSLFIASMLIGGNITMVVYTFYMSRLVGQELLLYNLSISIFWLVLLQILISTVVILIVSEFFPKVFFQIYANPLMRIFALPSYFFFWLLYYISVSMLWISDFILTKIFKTKGDVLQLTFTKLELNNYITEQMSSVEDNELVDSEIQIFQNALGFSRVKARDIMTPRTEIAAVDIFDPIEELREMFIETDYSKVLVFRESLDDIIGYVHSFELFRKPRSVKSIIIPVEFVPETILIKDVMELLTKKRKSMAVVLDEYGGTAGIVTMEDIVEELFGEIEDEHDQKVEDHVEVENEDGSYVLSARLNVEYLNEKYRFEIPESDSYGTLGGFIVHHAKEIPLVDDNVDVQNFSFRILRATNKKIELVKLLANSNRMSV